MGNGCCPVLRYANECIVPLIGKVLSNDSFESLLKYKSEDSVPEPQEIASALKNTLLRLEKRSLRLVYAFVGLFLCFLICVVCSLAK